jgi:hypothetical protein
VEVGSGSGSRTSAVRASISLRTRRIRLSASATVDLRSAAKRAWWPSAPISRPPSWTPECWSGLVAGRDGVRDFVDGAVEGAEPLQPPEDVHPPVVAWEAGVAADREHDGPSVVGQLVGELHTGRRRADDQHAAVG